MIYCFKLFFEDQTKEFAVKIQNTKRIFFKLNYFLNKHLSIYFFNIKNI